MIETGIQKLKPSFHFFEAFGVGLGLWLKLWLDVRIGLWLDFKDRVRVRVGARDRDRDNVRVRIRVYPMRVATFIRTVAGEFRSCRHFGSGHRHGFIRVGVRG